MNIDVTEYLPFKGPVIGEFVKDYPILVYLVGCKNCDKKKEKANGGK